jgi:hypothetical protein
MRNSPAASALAVAVAGLILGSATAAVAAEGTPTAKVKCSGINDCRGKSECHTATSKCAGKNECKGKGWISVDSEKTCTDKKGTVVK